MTAQPLARRPIAAPAHRLPVARTAAALGTLAVLVAHAVAQAAAPAGGEAAAPPSPLKTIVAQAGQGRQRLGFDGVVEAVRQTVLAAQVPGAVVQLGVKVGDRVQAGQVLLRLDARAADAGVTTSDAQVQVARAGLESAQRELDRQRQLARQHFISQAALDRAESDFKTTQAQLNAQLSQSQAARTQTSFNTVRAPYAGVVAEVPVALGDMAMPGRPLVTLYDPALRVSAAVPQTVAARVPAGVLPKVELPGLAAAAALVEPLRAQALPTVDAATHTQTWRADLPAGLAGVAPGMFARLWLPQAAAGGADAGSNPRVPAAAVVRRAELVGLYVLDPQGRPMLRQVRLGRAEGDSVEVLAGLAAGERVAVEPQAAARQAR